MYCEVVFYTVYPILLPLSRRFGWSGIVALGASLSLYLTLVTGISGMYARMDMWDPILGFPCWLVGCLLAESFARDTGSQSTYAVGYWRLAAWLLSSVCYGLMLHSPIGFRGSLPLFAVFCFFWLLKELNHARNRVGSTKILEKLGVASFSLYLVHPLAHQTWTHYEHGFWGLPPMQEWACRLTFILGCSALFYYAIERPSHALARRIGSSAIPQSNRGNV